MDTGQDPTVETPQAPEVPPPAAATSTVRRSGGRLKRIVVGAIVAFGGMVVLYGPTQAGQMVGLAVICTAGIGLIPIVFLSWLVGWIVLEAWAAISARRDAATAT